MFFDSDYDPFGKECGYLDLRLAIKGKENIAFVRALPSRKRTIVIKELIRKHIKLQQNDEIEWIELEHEEEQNAKEYERRMQEIKQRYQ